MRIKKMRATSGICKGCCFKSGISCTYPCQPKLNIYKDKGITSKTDSECDSRVDINWWVDDDPKLARECRGNWKRLHRKENRAKRIKLAKEVSDIIRLCKGGTTT